jgi:arylamine N-acetyltransferase
MLNREKISNIILREAKAVRGSLIGTWGESKGYCFESSVILGYRLKDLGIHTRLASGWVKLSNGNNCGHYWLLYNGMVLDITGDQFNYKLNNIDNIPDVLYTKCKNVSSIYRKQFDTELPPHVQHGEWARSICVCGRKNENI